MNPKVSAERNSVDIEQNILLLLWFKSHFRKAYMMADEGMSKQDQSRAKNNVTEMLDLCAASSADAWFKRHVTKINQFAISDLSNRILSFLPFTRRQHTTFDFWLELKTPWKTEQQLHWKMQTGQDAEELIRYRIYSTGV